MEVGKDCFPLLKLYTNNHDGEESDFEPYSDEVELSPTHHPRLGSPFFLQLKQKYPDAFKRRVRHWSAGKYRSSFFDSSSITSNSPRELTSNDIKPLQHDNLFFDCEEFFQNNSAGRKKLSYSDNFAGSLDTPLFSLSPRSVSKTTGSFSTGTLSKRAIENRELLQWFLTKENCPFSKFSHRKLNSDILYSPRVLPLSFINLPHNREAENSEARNLLNLNSADPSVEITISQTVRDVLDNDEDYMHSSQAETTLDWIKSNSDSPSKFCLETKKEYSCLQAIQLQDSFQASTENDTTPGFNEFDDLENFVSVVNMEQCDNTATLVQSEKVDYIIKAEFCTDENETNAKDSLMVKIQNKNIECSDISQLSMNKEKCQNQKTRTPKLKMLSSNFDGSSSDKWDLEDFTLCSVALDDHDGILSSQLNTERLLVLCSWSSKSKLNEMTYYESGDDENEEVTEAFNKYKNRSHEIEFVVVDKQDQIFRNQPDQTITNHSDQIVTNQSDQTNTNQSDQTVINHLDLTVTSTTDLNVTDRIRSHQVVTNQLDQTVTNSLDQSVTNSNCASDIPENENLKDSFDEEVIDFQNNGLNGAQIVCNKDDFRTFPVDFTPEARVSDHELELVDKNDSVMLICEKSKINVANKRNAIDVDGKSPSPKYIKQFDTVKNQGECSDWPIDKRAEETENHSRWTDFVTGTLFDLSKDVFPLKKFVLPWVKKRGKYHTSCSALDLRDFKEIVTNEFSRVGRELSSESMSSILSESFKSNNSGIAKMLDARKHSESKIAKKLDVRGTGKPEQALGKSSSLQSLRNLFHIQKRQNRR